MSYTLRNNSTIPSFDPFQASRIKYKGVYKEQRGVQHAPVNLEGYTPNSRVGKRIAEPWSLKLMAQGGKLKENEQFYGVKRHSRALDYLLSQQAENKKAAQIEHHKRFLKHENKKRGAAEQYFQSQLDAQLKTQQQAYNIAGLSELDQKNVKEILNADKDYFKDAMKNTPASQQQNRLDNLINDYFKDKPVPEVPASGGATPTIGGSTHGGSTPTSSIFGGGATPTIGGAPSSGGSTPASSIFGGGSTPAEPASPIAPAPLFKNISLPSPELPPPPAPEPPLGGGAEEGVDLFLDGVIDQALNIVAPSGSGSSEARTSASTSSNIHATPASDEIALMPEREETRRRIIDPEYLNDIINDKVSKMVRRDRPKNSVASPYDGKEYKRGDTGWELLFQQGLINENGTYTTKGKRMYQIGIMRKELQKVIAFRRQSPGGGLGYSQEILRVLDQIEP